MSIVIAKKINGRIVMCSDSASFRGDRKTSDNVKKIFKITDKVYIGGTGAICDTTTFITRFKRLYDNERVKELGFEPMGDTPSFEDAEDMILRVYQSMKDDERVSQSSTSDMFVAFGDSLYRLIFSKDDYEVSRFSEKELLDGVAIGMYTENIQIILKFMTPEDAIVAIHNNGGIYINDTIQKVVI